MRGPDRAPRANKPPMRRSTKVAIVAVPVIVVLAIIFTAMGFSGAFNGCCDGTDALDPAQASSGVPIQQVWLHIHGRQI